MKIGEERGKRVEDIIGQVDFEKGDGLVPVISQETSTGKILMLAYADKEALKKTIETGYAHYFSRSRNKLWMKGETSGHVQKVLEINIDCDNDAILLKVEQVGACCHKGYPTCFYKELLRKGEVQVKEERFFDPSKVYAHCKVLDEIQDVIKQRIKEKPKDSYVVKIFEEGTEKIAKKILEEASELAVALLKQEKEPVIYEAADLIFHIILGTITRDVKNEEIYEELKKRRKKGEKKLIINYFSLLNSYTLKSPLSLHCPPYATVFPVCFTQTG